MMNLALEYTLCNLDNKTYSTYRSHPSYVGDPTVRPEAEHCFGIASTAINNGGLVIDEAQPTNAATAPTAAATPSPLLHHAKAASPSSYHPHPHPPPLSQQPQPQQAPPPQVSGTYASASAGSFAPSPPGGYYRQQSATYPVSSAATYEAGADYGGMGPPEGYAPHCAYRGAAAAAAAAAATRGAFSPSHGPPQQVAPPFWDAAAATPRSGYALKSSPEAATGPAGRAVQLRSPAPCATSEFGLPGAANTANSITDGLPPACSVPSAAPPPFKWMQIKRHQPKPPGKFSEKGRKNKREKRRGGKGEEEKMKAVLKEGEMYREGIGVKKVKGETSWGWAGLRKRPQREKGNAGLRPRLRRPGKFNRKDAGNGKQCGQKGNAEFSFVPENSQVSTLIPVWSQSRMIRVGL